MLISQPNKWFHRIKIGSLLLVWLIFTILLMSNSDKVLQYRQMSVPVNATKSKFKLSKFLLLPVGSDDVCNGYWRENYLNVNFRLLSNINIFDKELIQVYLTTRPTHKQSNLG